MSPHLTTPTAYMHEGMNRAADTNPHRNLHVPHGDHPTILGQPLWHEDHAECLQGSSMLLHTQKEKVTAWPHIRQPRRFTCTRE